MFISSNRTWSFLVQHESTIFRKKNGFVLEQALEEPITTYKNWACHVPRWNGLGLIP